MNTSECSELFPFNSTGVKTWVFFASTDAIALQAILLAIPLCQL